MLWVRVIDLLCACQHDAQACMRAHLLQLCRQHISLRMRGSEKLRAHKRKKLSSMQPKPERTAILHISTRSSSNQQTQKQAAKGTHQRVSRSLEGAFFTCDKVVRVVCCQRDADGERVLQDLQQTSAPGALQLLHMHSSKLSLSRIEDAIFLYITSLSLAQSFHKNITREDLSI